MSARRRRPSAVDFGQALDRKAETLRSRESETEDVQAEQSHAPLDVPAPLPRAPLPVRFGYRMTLAESDVTDRLVHDLRSRTGNRRLTKGDMLRALALIASEDEALTHRVAEFIGSLEKLAR